MPDPDFNPRSAALNHAARVSDDDLRNHSNALACGLIYVGDQLAALNTEGTLFDNRLNTIGSTLETLDVSITNGLTAIADEL